MRIKSIWIIEIRNLLIKSRTKKTYVLLYALAWPFYIMAWVGRLICLVVCMVIGLSGLYMFATPFFSSKSHMAYSDFPLLLIGLILPFLCVRYVLQLKRAFKSEEVYIELLLPAIGLILFGLIGAFLCLI